MQESELVRSKIGIGMIACLLISVITLHMFLTKLKVDENGGVISISGSLEDFLFETKKNHGTDFQYYALKFKNSPDIFQINSDMIWLFKKTDFLNNIEIGDVIVIQIPKEKDKFKMENGNIPLYGIFTEDRIFLDPNDVLREERAPVSLLISMITFLAAIVLFVLFRRTPSSKEPQPTLI